MKSTCFFVKYMICYVTDKEYRRIKMSEPVEIMNIKENYNNRDYVLKAVSEQGILLDFADESFKDDKEIVLAAISNNPEALEFASDRLKSDRDVVFNSVSKVRLDILLHWRKIIKR